MGFARSCSNSSHSEKSFKMCNLEYRHSKTCSNIPESCNFVKKHSCLESPKAKSDVTLRSVSLPPRPSTRRHPYEMPRKLQGKSRSHPAVALSNKNNSAAQSSETLQPKSKRKHGKSSKVAVDVPPSSVRSPSVSTTSSSRSNRRCPCGDENGSRRTSVGSEKKESGFQNGSVEMPTHDEGAKRNTSRGTAADSDRSTTRVEEHEYLQFLLRITEDIIVNNYFRNNDIERVFESHMNTNKGRLDMEKMREHVAELASELSLPYKNRETSTNEPRLGKLAVKPLPVVSIDPLADCSECSSLRVSDLPANIPFSKDLEYNETDPYKLTNSDEIFMNRRSLGRVTECTEPSNSIETILNASSKFASRATLSTGGNDTFSSFGNVEASALEDAVDATDSLNLIRRVSADENFNMKKFEDIPLTEKERKVSTEEETIFKKFKDNHNDNTVFGETMEKTVDYQFNMTDKVVNENNRNSASRFILGNMVDELSLKFTDNKYIQTTSSLISTKDIDIQAETLTDESMVVKAKEGEDKCTQTNVLQCDKQCETSGVILKDPDFEDEFVLIRSPVYVLKTALGEKEKSMSPRIQIRIKQPATPKLDPHSKEKNEDTFMEESHDNQSDKLIDSSEYRADANHNQEDPFHMRQTDYTKLLSSDYDLTPERDSSTTDKYHHLLVDASTSFTNIRTGTAPHNLLLSEKYSLHNAGEMTEEKSPHNLDLYYLSNSESTQDNKYEVRSYTMPSSTNKNVSSFTYCVNSPEDDRSLAEENSTRMGMSLADYEIGPRSAVEIREAMIDRSSSPTSSLKSTRDVSIGEIVSRRANHL